MGLTEASIWSAGIVAIVSFSVLIGFLLATALVQWFLAYRRKSRGESNTEPSWGSSHHGSEMTDFSHKSQLEIRDEQMSDMMHDISEQPAWRERWCNKRFIFSLAANFLYLSWIAALSVVIILTAVWDVWPVYFSIAVLTVIWWCTWFLVFHPNIFPSVFFPYTPEEVEWTDTTGPPPEGVATIGKLSPTLHNLWHQQVVGKLAGKGYVHRKRRLILFWTLSGVLIVGAFVICILLEGVCYAGHPSELSTRFTRAFRDDLCEGNSPCHVYLTLPQDPSTGVIINYHTNDIKDDTLVYYDTVSHASSASGSNSRPDLSQYAFSTKGYNNRINFLRIERIERHVHWVHLTNLAPNTTYYFVAGYSGDNKYYSTERKFRTLPSSGAVKFGAGGDVGYEDDSAKFLSQMASQNISFLAIGGDLAYANALVGCYRRWDRWLTMLEKAMVDLQGYTIPVIYALGNHEVTEWTWAPFFRTYFAQGSNSQNEDFGDRKMYNSYLISNTSVFLALDSDHVTSSSDQRSFIDNTLTLYSSRKAKMAIYHIPMYPAGRAFNSEPSVILRNNWLSLFDKHKMSVVFENHEHTFARSKRLTNNQVTPNGTLYVGDGCMGVHPRDPGPLQWYSEKNGMVMNAAVVDLKEDGDVAITMIDINGGTLDYIPTLRVTNSTL